MSENSQITDFLDEQAGDGRNQGQGEFTVKRQGALNKLAQHSLPFAGAWLLKMVQAAAASGCRHGITVNSTREETVVRFDTARAWRLEEVRQAFGDPAPCTDEVLSHLQFALWGAGVSGGHPFELHLPGRTEALIWQGQGDLLSWPLKPPPPTVVLRVAHITAGEEPGGFFARGRRAAAINAETASALSNHCYTCPVPLTLDGRRLDSLFLAPSSSGNGIGQPVELSFVSATGCPEWPIPPGTLEGFDRGPGSFQPDLIDSWTREALGDVRPLAGCSVVCVYLAHIGQRLTGRSPSWEKESSKSSLYWVKDGVLVCHEVFPMEPTTLSLTCYMSAAGLTTDLTTLQLVTDDVKAARRADAIRAISLDIMLPRDFSFDKLVLRSRQQDQTMGGAAAIGGVLALLFPPIGLLLLWAGRTTFREAGHRMQTLVDDAVAGYALLQKGWRRCHRDGLPKSPRRR